MQTDFAYTWENKNTQAAGWLAASIPLLLVFTRAGADAAFSAVGLLFLLHSYKTRQWQWVRQPFTLAALACWSYLALSNLALYQNPAGLAWVRFPLFFLSVVFWLSRDAALWQRISKFLPVLLIGISASGLWEYFFTPLDAFHRLYGVFRNPVIGIYLVKWVFPAFALMALFGRMKWGLAFAALCAVVIFLSGERTASLIFLIGLFCAFFWLACRRREWAVKIMLLFAAVVLGALFIVLTQEAITLRMAYLFSQLKDFSASPYGNLFYTGWVMGAQHAITGVGLSHFNENCVLLMNSLHTDYCDLHPHNPYLQWWSEAGGVGVVLFLALLATLAQLWHKMAKHSPNALQAACCLGVLVVHFFPLMVSQNMFSNWPGMLLWASLAYAYAAMAQKHQPLPAA